MHAQGHHRPSFLSFKPDEFSRPAPPIGHYVPLLAQAILDHNSGLADGQQKLGLQGYAVGNPWTDPTLDNAGGQAGWDGGVGARRMVGCWTCSSASPQAAVGQSRALCCTPSSPRLLALPCPALHSPGAVEVWYSEGMIRQETYEGLKEHCNMSAVGKELRRRDTP